MKINNKGNILKEIVLSFDTVRFKLVVYTSKRIMLF